MDLIGEVKKKKEFSGLPDSVVERALGESGEDVKEARALLRKYFGVFLTNRVLRGRGDILKSHISSKKRDYEEFYGRIFEVIKSDFSMQNCDTSGAAFHMENGGNGGKIKVLDLGCGVNGFSYEYLPRDTRYVGVEAAGQLVEQMNSFFVESDFNGKAVCGDLFDLDFVGEILRDGFDVVFLFQVVDALESVEKNFSKKLIELVMERVGCLVISLPLVSLGGRKRIGAEKRKWLVDWLDEKYKIVKDFEMFGERILVVRK